jgi:hypothetical protein
VIRTIGSTEGTNFSGSLGYRNVVDTCIGGATSATWFSRSSAWRAFVDEWLWFGRGMFKVQRVLPVGIVQV